MPWLALDGKTVYADDDERLLGYGFNPPNDPSWAQNNPGMGQRPMTWTDKKVTPAEEN